MFQRLTKTAAVVAIAGAMLSPLAAGAFHDGDNDIVRDVRGTAVKDVRGNCVVTKWDGNNDRCGDKAPMPKFSHAERNIYFPFDSAELTPRAKAKLDYIATNVIGSSKIIKATLTGYADPIGSVDYNRSLSKRRAVAAQNYLANKGYLDTRVTTLMAKGETAAFSEGCSERATRTNIACLQPNRRVEITFEKMD